MPVPEQGANSVVRRLAETRGIRYPRLIAVVQTNGPLVDRDFDALPGFGGLREGGEGANARGREELGDAKRLQLVGGGARPDEVIPVALDVYDGTVDAPFPVHLLFVVVIWTPWLRPARQDPGLAVLGEIYVPGPVDLVQLRRPDVVPFGLGVAHGVDGLSLARLEPLEGFGPHDLHVSPCRGHQVVVAIDVDEERVRAVNGSKRVGEGRAADERREQ